MTTNTTPAADPPPYDGWSNVVDASTGRTYYWNRETGETAWTIPSHHPAVVQRPPAPAPGLHASAAPPSVTMQASKLAGAPPAPLPSAPPAPLPSAPPAPRPSAHLGVPPSMPPASLPSAPPASSPSVTATSILAASGSVNVSDPARRRRSSASSFKTSTSGEVSSPTQQSHINPTINVVHELHALVLFDDAGQPSPASSTPAFKKVEEDLTETLQVFVEAHEAAAASGASETDFRMLDGVQQQLDQMEARFLRQVATLTSEQEQTKATVLFIETKLAGYGALLDESLARREMHGHIVSSPHHDVYYRAYMEALNATYQAAMVIKTELVKVELNNAKGIAARVVGNVGKLVGQLVPTAGGAISTTTSIISFLLNRMGEKEQRAQLARITTTFPNPSIWFSIVEDAAAQVTEARWADIAALRDRSSTASKVTRFFKAVSEFLDTLPAQTVYQRVATEDALGGLDDLTAALETKLLNEDATVKLLVVSAAKQMEAVGTSARVKAKEAMINRKASDATQAAVQAELHAKMLKHQLNQRVVVARRFGASRGGVAVSVVGDLASLKTDVAKALDIKVAALRFAESEALITDVALLKNQDVVVATTLEQENSQFKDS